MQTEGTRGGVSGLDSGEDGGPGAGDLGVWGERLGGERGWSVEQEGDRVRGACGGGCLEPKEASSQGPDGPKMRSTYSPPTLGREVLSSFSL